MFAITNLVIFNVRYFATLNFRDFVETLQQRFKHRSRELNNNKKETNTQKDRFLFQKRALKKMNSVMLIKSAVFTF